MKLIKKIAFVIMCIFSLVGLLVGGTLIHELIHKSDFKEIKKTNERMCILTFPNETGFYEFSFDKKQIPQYNKIMEYTELKAYSIELMIIIIFIISFFIALDEVWKQN